LSGSARINDTMSSVLTGENIRSTQPTGAGVNDGGSAPAVAAQ